MYPSYTPKNLNNGLNEKRRKTVIARKKKK